MTAELEKALAEISEKDSAFETFKSELETVTKQQLESKDIEFQKLLTENTSLIDEIDLAQDKIEAHEEQLALLKAELEEGSSNIEGRVSELKETLNTKNYEITNLTADKAALETQVEQLKNELANWESSPNKNEEQEEFVNRLTKQIESLTEERLGLLNEKEEMANQLLKMNEVVNSISQGIDAQNIDVTDLNNHRKNIILAQSSGGTTNEKTVMKKQINELVREIDKCIALLSA